MGPISANLFSKNRRHDGALALISSSCGMIPTAMSGITSLFFLDAKVLHQLVKPSVDVTQRRLHLVELGIIGRRRLQSLDDRLVLHDLLERPVGRGEDLVGVLETER